LITLAVLGWLLWQFVKIQLNPFTRCRACGGSPPGDGRGNYHRCWSCGGASERLKVAAWVMLKVGIPVPRAKKSAKRNRMGL
jgi:tRNA(Ile2) C34 agmatinyltransferase TiaS